MTAQASVSALPLGLPAVAPEIRSELGLSLAATGALLAASNVGIIAVLLAWGALADRVGERVVIVAGLTGSAAALLLAARAGSAPSWPGRWRSRARSDRAPTRPAGGRWCPGSRPPSAASP
jgi:MFS family permease